MRSTMVIGGVLFGTAAVTLGFVACHHAQPRASARLPTAPTARLRPGQRSGRRAGQADSAVPSSEAIRAAPNSSGNSRSPLANSDCERSAALVAPLPADGVIFNNAMTSADAGAIDRGAAVLLVLEGARSAMECCADGWARQHAGQEATMMLVVDLAADGSVRSATVDGARSDLAAPEAATCAAAVVRARQFPPSPRGVSTVVEYPVRLRARVP